MSDYILDKTFQSGGSSFSGNLVVVPASVDSSKRIIPGVASPSGYIAPLGVVVDNTDATLGQNPVVRIMGTIDCVAGAAITTATQNNLTWDSAGRVIPIGSTSGTAYPVIGQALEDVTTLGDKVLVRINPGVITTHA